MSFASGQNEGRKSSFFLRKKKRGIRLERILSRDSAALMDPSAGRTSFRTDPSHIRRRARTPRPHHQHSTCFSFRERKRNQINRLAVSVFSVGFVFVLFCFGRSEDERWRVSVGQPPLRASSSGSDSFPFFSLLFVSSSSSFLFDFSSFIHSLGVDRGGSGSRYRPHRPVMR